MLKFKAYDESCQYQDYFLVICDKVFLINKIQFSFCINGMFFALSFRRLIRNSNMVLSMKKSFNKDLKNDQLEELHYGPGIVSKLRCRYMSLTLNQGCTKQRPSLNFLRRSTSLNNLIETSETKALDQVLTQKPENVKMNGDANPVTKSYETLLEPKQNQNNDSTRRNSDIASENEQPPPDVVNYANKNYFY